MKWVTFRGASNSARSRASLLFSEAMSLLRTDTGLPGAMLHIDVHMDRENTYRVFRNGAVDYGVGEGPDGVTSVEFFVAMTVEASVGIGHTSQYNFHEAMDANPGDTVESLYWRAWSKLAKEHRFDSSTAVVTAWNIVPNVVPGLRAKCRSGNCKNAQRPDSIYCDGHDR